MFQKRQSVGMKPPCGRMELLRYSPEQRRKRATSCQDFYRVTSALMLLSFRASSSYWHFPIYCSSLVSFGLVMFRSRGSLVHGENHIVSGVQRADLQGILLGIQGRSDKDFYFAATGEIQPEWKSSSSIFSVFLGVLSYFAPGSFLLIGGPFALSVDAFRTLN